MNQKLEQVRQLINQNKFKKALPIIKKINAKPTLTTDETLELESICLYHQKSYQLSRQKLQQALGKTTLDSKKIAYLNNLAALNQRLGDISNAIQNLEYILKIDGSLNTADQRKLLIQFYFQESRYSEVQKYAPLLLNIQKHAIETLLLLSKASFKDQKLNDSEQYLLRLIQEIKTLGVEQFSAEQLIQILNGLHSLKLYEKERALLVFIADKFKDEDWYAEILDRANNGKQSKTEQSESSYQVPLDINEFNYLQPNLVGNTLVIVNSLQSLMHVLKEQGAVFHPELIIAEDKGEITTYCQKANIPKDKLMQMPFICMPLVDDYDYQLDASLKLTATAKKHQVNPYADEIMQRLVDFYNVSEKLKHWHDTFPLFALSKTPELANKLIAARNNCSDALKVYSDYISGDKGNAIVQSFFASRVFTFQQEEMRPSGITLKHASQKGFIPLLELANHKMGAPGFQTNTAKNQLEILAKTTDDKGQVQVQYNLDDPLITYLSYGFIDESAKWIYTAPVMLQTLTGVKIQVSNFMKMINQTDIDAKHLTLRAYLPSEIIRQDNQISVSKLIIPQFKSRNILHEVLSYILLKTDIADIYTNKANLAMEVENLEKQLITTNQLYWQEVNELMLTNELSISKTTFSTLKQLITYFKKHLAAYQNHFILMTK